MRFVLERVSQPEVEPVSLAEMKRHLREFADITENDDDITALIIGGRQWVEHETGRALVDQSWRLTLTDKFGVSDSVAAPDCCGFLHPLASEIQLRRSPVLSITEFVTVDALGDEVEIDADTYELREADSKWPKLVGLSGASWGSGTFRITFRAGFADRTASPGEDVSVIPVTLRQAIKLWVEANYDRDEKTMKLLLDTAERLIESERCHFGLA